MPKIQYLHKTRQGIPDIYAQMFGDILQNMNFSRYYRNRGKFIYGFDPNIILLYVFYTCAIELLIKGRLAKDDGYGEWDKRQHRGA